MALQAIPAFASAIGGAGTDDPNVGRAAPISAQQEFMNPIDAFKQDPRSSVSKILDPGAVFLKGKSKFRQPALKSLSELLGDARSQFRNNQSGFLQDQLDAQRSAFSPFFDIRDQTVAQGQSLISRLTEGDLARRTSTQEIRSAQAARGLSLSPAAAVQEGLQVSQAQQRSEIQALGLGQQLAQFSASTPLQLQQIDFGQLLSTGSQRDLAQAGFSSEAQVSNINLAQDRRSESFGFLGSFLGAFDKPKAATGTPTSSISTTQGGFSGPTPPGGFVGPPQA